MLPQLFIFKSKNSLTQQIKFLEEDKWRVKPQASAVTVDSVANSVADSGADLSSENTTTQPATAVFPAKALQLPEVDLEALEKTQRYHLEVYDGFSQVEDVPVNEDEIRNFINASLAKFNDSIDEYVEMALEDVAGFIARAPGMTEEYLNQCLEKTKLYHQVICYFANPKTVTWEILKLLESIQNRYNESVTATPENPHPVKLQIVCLGAGINTVRLLDKYIRGKFSFILEDEQHQNPPQPLKLRYELNDISDYDKWLSRYKKSESDQLILRFYYGEPLKNAKSTESNTSIPSIGKTIGTIGMVFDIESSTLDYQGIFNKIKHFPNCNLKFVPVYRANINEAEIAQICKRHEAQLATPVVFKSSVKGKAPRVAPMVYWFTEARTFNLVLKYLGDNFISSQKPVILLTPSIAKFDEERFGLRRIKSKLDREGSKAKNQPCYDPVKPMSFIMENLTSLQNQMIFEEEDYKCTEVINSAGELETWLDPVREKVNSCEIYQIVKRDAQGLELEPNQQFPLVVELKSFNQNPQEIQQTLVKIIRAKYYY